MRVIAIGDKVRYQILRSIITGMKSKDGLFQTERLGAKTIRIVSDYDNTSETVFYSNRLPLATEIVFPAEWKMFDGQICSHDKMIFFDEFPYRTQEGLKCLTQYMELDNCSSFCEVAVVINNRKAMEGDLTTEADAAKSACEEYLKEGFCVRQYNMQNNMYDFWFWNVDSDAEINTAKVKRKIKKIKEEIFDKSLFDKSLFDSEYELGYITFDCNDPAFLDSLFLYHEGAQNSMENFIRRFWLSDKVKQYIALADKIYGEYIVEICVWDYQKDLKLLNDKIYTAFKTCFKDIRNISYSGTEEQYPMWIDENMNVIMQIKERVVSFLNTQLREEIKGHIKERIEKLEELFDEETI